MSIVHQYQKDGINFTGSMIVLEIKQTHIDISD